LPGSRAHCISAGRSAAQQRGCVSIPPQPRRLGLAARLQKMTKVSRVVLKRKKKYEGSPPALLAPIFLGFALHRWRRGILALDPIARAAGDVGEPSRFDTLALRRMHWSKEASGSGFAFPWPKDGINCIYPWTIDTMVKTIIR
jgi:hypothetical protein